MKVHQCICFYKTGNKCRWQECYLLLTRGLTRRVASSSLRPAGRDKPSQSYFLHSYRIWSRLLNYNLLPRVGSIQRSETARIFVNGTQRIRLVWIANTLLVAKGQGFYFYTNRVTVSLFSKNKRAAEWFYISLFLRRRATGKATIMNLYILWETFKISTYF